MADIEQMMRTLKLGGLAKDWREVEYHDTEQYVTDLLQIELHEREVNRINRMVKTAGFHVIKTLDDFVWKPEIGLPAGLTREYMENLDFITAKENLIFLGAVGHRQDASRSSDRLESVSGETHDSLLYSGFTCKYSP